MLISIGMLIWLACAQWEGWKSVTIMIMCAAGVYLARLRLTSPIEILVWRGGVKVIYWRNASREWRADELSVRANGLGDQLGGWRTVINRATGKIAFRVFRDVPRYEEFPAALEGAAGGAA